MKTPSASSSPFAIIELEGIALDSGVRAFQGGVNHAEGGVAIMPKNVWGAGRVLA
jgi:hypothetical protein